MSPVGANNPIIPGFAPDPSVCVINSTYFLVNSSFHIFPGLPIYTSRDLVSWKHIGNAINRPSQLSLWGATTTLHPGDDGNTILATGGLYAPTIRHHQGRTYILCTNIVHGHPKPEQNFIIHTDDILSGAWSDPVYYDFPGIDPSILFDDDGKIYVQGTLSNGFQLCNMEIDLDTGATVTPRRKIWDGWDQRYSEGPHIYKNDGWYYLLCAEGGTFTYHMLSLARSQSIWGPYEGCPNNPLWTAADKPTNFVQHTGHGDLFQDTESRWWIVLLGVRKSPHSGRYIMGRETFITSVDWPRGDAWPRLQPVLADPAQSLTSNPTHPDDDDIDWVYLRDPELHRFSRQHGTHSLRPSTTELSSAHESPSFVGKRQRLMVGEATVTLSIPSSGREPPSSSLSSSMSVSESKKQPAIRAGLVVFKDELRFLAFGCDLGTQQIFFDGVNTVSGFAKHETQVVEGLKSVDKLTLKIRYTDEAYEFLFAEGSTPVSSWRLLANVDTIELCEFDFTGPLIGMFAVVEGDDGAPIVYFEDFKVDKRTTR